MHCLLEVLHEARHINRRLSFVLDAQIDGINHLDDNLKHLLCLVCLTFGLSDEVVVPLET